MNGTGTGCSELFKERRMGWQVLLWLAGAGTVACAVGCIVLLARKRRFHGKAVKAVKYVFIALVPLVWGIGVMVAETPAGKDKAAAIGMLLLLAATAAAFLGDKAGEL